MLKIHTDIDIAPYTTFHLHGRVERLIEFSTADDLATLQRQGELERFFVVGGGSNLLFTPTDGKPTLLHPTMEEVSIEICGDAAVVTAGAGATLDNVTELCCRRGLWGMENLSLIPGTVGGAVVQNCGAYGSEVADVLSEVTVFDTDSSRVISLPASELGLSYRNSIFKTSTEAKKWIVLEATFRLSAQPRPRLGYKALAETVANAPELTAMLIREAVMAMRQAKLPEPSHTGSAGSYFKNPVVPRATAEGLQAEYPDMPVYVNGEGGTKLSAAWLIDHAGGKGFTLGGAAVWPKQALVIVNSHNATAEDVLGLEAKIADAVRAKFGVNLECEVIKI